MAKITFSKLDPLETLSRLKLLGSSRGSVTIWQKGKSDKYTYKVLKFDKDRMEVLIDSMNPVVPNGTAMLCSFEMRGMNFFSEVIFQTALSKQLVLQFKNILYQSERRSNFRLLTYPIYEIWAEFNIQNSYEGGKVIDIRNRTSQTSLFKNFLQMLTDESPKYSSEKIRIRVQNISATGFALDIGPIESEHFKKDMVFENINIYFSDEVIQIPQTKIVYIVDSQSSDKNIKNFRLGAHFENLPQTLDEKISGKINQLLREIDANKDFENFIK